MRQKILLTFALLLAIAQGAWGAIAADGKLPGAFSVSATKQVWFSQGNLQYQANSTGAASAPYTGVWRFATNQYDAIGSGNSNVSASYDGWIDSFGWGSGNQPTQTSEDPNVYSTFVDWGTNAISNGGNTANQWRTLSESEWTYLVFTRPNASSKRGRATINGMYCFVLLPDVWVLPSGLSFTPDANNWTNVYTVEEWAQMEDAGAVCFPAAGSRAGGTNNTNVNDYNRWCCYWSSTSANSSQGYNLWITSDHVGTTDKGNYQMGASVRLVSETMFPGSGTEEVPYLISSEAAWNYLADQVSAGNTYSGKSFRQTANINVTTMVGNSSDSKPFSGTYDGDGKTLNLSLNTSTPHTAPFRLIANATIKNVVTTGTVHSTDNHPSGLVGETDGTCTIQNCRVSASVGGPEYLGGIVGHCWHANISIIGCVYSGTLTPASGQWTGGIIGWGGDGGGHTISISDCLFAGTLTGSTKFHPIGILQNQSNTKYLSNTYYTLGAQNTNDDASFVKGLSYKGKFARSISAGSDVTAVANAGEATVYDVSGITSYGTGILYNGVLYAGNGEAVSLNLSHGDKEGYTFNQYTISGGGSLANPTTNTPTLTMTDANQTINAEWLENTATLSQATDNSTFISANNGLIYDITLGRTMNAGGWNTFCVPFEISSSQIESVFGSGTEVRELGSSDFDEGTKALTLNFTKASTIEAGKPYLVYLGSGLNVVNPTFEDVTIVSGTTTKTTDYANFVPVMNPTSLTGGDKSILFVTGGDKLTYPSSTGNINGFRAYFQLKGDAVAAARSFAMSFDGETDGIRSIENSELRVENSYYDLQGRRVVQPTKGLYIVNGKKLIIK